MSLKHLALPALALACTTLSAQAPAAKPTYLPTPSFDIASINPSADPCNDFYKFACGNYAANHPIPADQASTDGFYTLYNVNTEELSGILAKYEKPDPSRTPDQQKIGDFYHACMDTDAIEKSGLTPIAGLLAEIDSMTLRNLPSLAGKLSRINVTVFFGFGEQQDLKDATKQIANIDQGGLGMPEKDYYLRTGAKDEQLRKDYVAHMTKMLTLAGSTPQQALKDATAVMAFETALAKASMGVTERRDPEKTYHLVPISEINKSFPYGLFGQFEDAVHSPRVTEINDANPSYIPAAVALIRDTDLETLRAYIRYHLLTAEAHNLPKSFDQENFDFYGRKLTGSEVQRARWKRCSAAVDGDLGEALGKVYVNQYFAGDSKKKTLEMVTDIEDAMDRDIDQLDWMSPATKTRAKEKLHLVANKIGYPDHFRDYSSVTIKPTDAIGNDMRATQFENDRQLNKIGNPVDHQEWGMTPPTVNAYYNPSMNDINFPAGILQPNFYDPRQDDAVNYGHIGAVIGHELTHGFDDEGKKFDGNGNLSDWWTAEDTKKFEAKTDCEVNEYNQFVAVDDVHVNGKLTLGENTADNGGLLLAYMAYLDRAKKQGVDLAAKKDGYTPIQRFYISFGQNWCANDRPEAIRSQVLTDPHSPDQFRTNGPIVNQPGFAAAFSCKANSPMTPTKSCRVW
ncbi:M13 family metallopeptidase [Granulicella tundricola]|uniref:Neprilysin n=1 Tax=Granulicella tundricola (strain ATCC BAA-1859 / DSM 23138 / MP5ACTX9) TaxID=1198114 RepID=E8WZM6_GRATM|nr:M13 family metallopeptidase [Granulicella tundricola]ADW70000.1 Neprilysin [Granulicella tundricola MP5ACTX9]